jgi:DNA-binding beta-propeller fold protein YncE
MSRKRFAAVAIVLASVLAVCSCSGPAEPQGEPPSADTPAAAALRDAGSVEGLGASRWGSRAAQGTTAPSFVIDASWPKPLPNDWRIGQVGGIAVDSHDNIWVYHRPRTLDASSAGALPRVATNDRGVPISALGHPRPYAERSTGCCVPAPSVLKFDRAGNLLAAWGGPSDPGFLDRQCREADGCFWPAREHGIFVDHNDFVYLSGNGEDGGARQQQGVATYPWAPSFGDDSHILKFTVDGTFVYQIGTAGMEGPNSEKIDGGPNGTPQPYLVADMSVDPKTNRLYVADGYGNRRILIVDAETGKYVGHFGAYGQNPVTDDPSSGVADTDVGPWIADYQAGRMKPPFFRSPMHCATVSRDGFLYACDRGNNRVQVFDVNAADLGKPCANPNAEAGKCGFVSEVHVAPQTASGTSGTAALSTDAEQSCLYVGDLANGTLYILNRDNLTELDRIGRAGRQAGEFHWLHALAVDSSGNIYTGEVDTGQRVQKFLRYGSTGCSGTGSAEVGLYGANR